MSALTEKLGRMFRWGKSGKELDIHVAADADDLPVRKMSKAQQREATLMQLKQGYEEVTDTMKSLRGHMEEQARRSDRMLSLMEGVPDVLRSIPEANERQTQVLKAMHGQMENQVRTSEQLSSALVELAGATGRHQDVLSNLQSQIEASRQSGESLRDSLGILSETMETMTDASRSNVDAVNRIAEQSKTNQQQTEALYQRTQRHSVVMASVSWALALAALAVAGYVAVMVSQVAQQPATPADSEPSATTVQQEPPTIIPDAASAITPAPALLPEETDEAAPAPVDDVDPAEAPIDIDATPPVIDGQMDDAAEQVDQDDEAQAVEELLEAVEVIQIDAMAPDQVEPTDAVDGDTEAQTEVDGQVETDAAE